MQICRHLKVPAQSWQGSLRGIMDEAFLRAGTSVWCYHWPQAKQLSRGGSPEHECGAT